MPALSLGVGDEPAPTRITNFWTPGAPLANQLFARKSIDKLIADAEDPEHRLKKSLGPWSLTALGIGAIIGSGIFVLTGTAAAGEHFEAPSLLHAQVLDLLANFLRTGSTAGALMHLSLIHICPRILQPAFSVHHDRRISGHQPSAV